MSVARFEVKPTELLIIVKEWNHLKGIFWVKYNLNSTVGVQYIRKSFLSYIQWLFYELYC